MTTKNSKPSVTTVSVTPELAEQWLGKNVRNRNIRQVVVSAYARDMAAGRWQFTGDAVKFGANGDLLDGQHRLHAVVQSGASVDLLVIRGLAQSTQDVMDTGPRRAVSDSLHLDGYKNPTILAAAARFAMTGAKGNMVDSRNQSAKPTHSEIREFIEANADLEQAVAAVAHYRTQIDLSTSVTAVAWWELARLDIEQCETFFSSIANMVTDGMGDPRNALLQRLNSARRNGERLTQTIQLSLLFRAWNAWVKGDEVRVLPTRTSSTNGAAAEVRIPKPVKPRRGKS